MLLHWLRSRRLLVVAGVIALVVSACGGGAEPTATPRPTATPPPTAAPPTATSPAPSVAPTATVATAATATPTAAAPRPTATPTPTPIPVSRLQQILATTGVGGLRYLANAPNPLLPPKSGGVLKIATTQYPPSLDNIKQRQPPSFEVNNNVYNRLLRCAYGAEMTGYSPTDCELIPELAERWDVSGDGKVYTFRMRQGIKFQNIAPVNGREVTAEDAAWSLNKYLVAPLHRHQAAWASSTERVEAVDRYTVRLTLKQPNGLYLSAVIQYFSSLVLPPELEPQMDTKSIGTGPFQLKQLVPGVKFTLERNPGYWRKDREGRQLPFLDGVEYVTIVDRSAARAAFRTGQFHAGQGSAAATIAERDAFLKELPAYSAYEWTPPSSGLYLGVRNDEKPFDDIRVRRAISMSIDRGAVIQAVAAGLGNLGPPLPWHYAFDAAPALKDMGPYYQYNPTEAKRLLQAAGISLPWKLTYEYPPVLGPPHSISAELWKEQAKAAGIDLQLSGTDTTTFFANYYQWSLGQRPGLVHWHSITIQLNAWGEVYNELHSGVNPNGIADPELDALLEKALAEQDAVKQKQLWRKVWEREVDQAYRPGLFAGLTGWTFEHPAMQGYLLNHWSPLTSILAKPVEIIWLGT